MENPRVLVEMSRWLLDHLSGANSVPESPRKVFRQAFDSCGTLEEFDEFLKAHAGEPVLSEIEQEWHHLVESTPPAPHHARQVVLPDF